MIEGCSFIRTSMNEWIIRTVWNTVVGTSKYNLLLPLSRGGWHAFKILTAKYLFTAKIEDFHDSVSHPWFSCLVFKFPKCTNIEISMSSRCFCPVFRIIMPLLSCD